MFSLLNLFPTIAGLHLTSRRHVGGQDFEKHFSPLGTKLYSHVNSSRKTLFTPNMTALSRGCKPRIGCHFKVTLH